MCLQSVAKKHDSFYITEEGGQASDSSLERILLVPQINRKEKNFLLHFARLLKMASHILAQEKPQVVITTGALIAFPFCLLQKLRGGKVVYIESFARVKDASLTGKLIYPFADLFLIQWESLAEVYPKAKYVGGIF